MERKNICEINRGLPINCGSESYIYKVEIDTTKQIYKEFLNETSKITLNRKLKKLLLLEKNPQIDCFFPKTKYIIMSILNEYMRGYTMEEIVGITPSKNNLSLENKLHFLKQLKLILELLLENDIFYFDIRTPNIIIDDSKIYLLDKDNIQTAKYPLDKIPTALKYYITNGGSFDEKAIKAMFNIFTHELLENEDIEFEKEGIKIIRLISSKKTDTIFDNEYLFEYVKK